MKTLFLAETKDQVTDLLKRKEAKNAVWVALTPFAMHELDSRGIDYKIQDDFYTEEELWRTGLECNGIAKNIFHKLDDFAMSRSEELRKANLRLYTNYSYPLHMIFDTVLIRVFQIGAILKSINPDIIFCHKSKIYPFYPWGDLGYIGFDKCESLYNRILENSSWKNKIYFIIPRDKEKGRLCNNDAYIWIFNRIKDSLSFLKESVFSKSAVNLTLVGGGYEWNMCEPRFNMNGARFKRLNIICDKKTSYIKDAKLEDEILHAVGGLLIFRGVDISNLLISRLAYIYKEGKRRCLEAYSRAERHIRKFDSKALLFSTLSMPEWRSAALAFNQRKIPSFCKPHGVFGITELIKVEDSDLLYANNYLANGAQTEKIYKKYEQTYSHNNLRVITTGSPKLESLRNNRGKLPGDIQSWLRDHNRAGSKKIGLYVTANYLQNFYYVYFRPAPSDNARFNSQKSIISFFKNREDSLLIWKLHPNLISDRPPRIENEAHNILTVRDEASFSDLLDAAEFVVMDDAFTVCQETATRDIPMFVLMKHIRYRSDAREMLEKRAVCCDKLEDLLAELDMFLINGAYDADIKDDTFLKAYGANEDGSSATEKTVSTVMNIVRYKTEGDLAR